MAIITCEINLPLSLVGKWDIYLFCSAVRIRNTTSQAQVEKGHLYSLHLAPWRFMTTRMDPGAFSLASLGYSEVCSISQWAIPWYVDGRWLPGCLCQPERIYFTLLMRLACFLIGMPRWGDYLGLPRRVVKISLNSNRKFHRAVSRNGSSYHLMNGCYMPMTLYLHLICVKILTTLQMWKT